MANGKANTRYPLTAQGLSLKRDMMSIHVAETTSLEQAGTGAGSSLSEFQLPSGLAFEALAENTGCAVFVIGSGGVIRWANEECASRFGAPKQEILGRRIEDLFPADVAGERMAVIREVMASQAKGTLDGMIRGVKRRTTYHPMTLDDGSNAVLAVCRPLCVTSASPSRSAGFVEAKFQDRGPLSTLTEREWDVLTLIGMGLSTQNIADKLHRSVKTIEWHRVSLGNKLGISNRVELARVAIRAGVSSLADEVHESPK